MYPTKEDKYIHKRIAVLLKKKKKRIAVFINYSTFLIILHPKTKQHLSLVVGLCQVYIRQSWNSLSV